MVTLTTEALLNEFYAGLRAGNRKKAMELLERQLPAGDLRVVLAYATANVEDGDGLAAVSLLMQHEGHRENLHYALLSAAAARLLSQQIDEWGDRAERQLLHIIDTQIERPGLLHQIQHYMQLCRTSRVPAHPKVRSALQHFGLIEPPDDPVRATFLGYGGGRSTKHIKTITLPPAPLFLESNACGWRPRVDQKTIIDVDAQDFKIYHNVRLYMLPFMYGLIESEENKFLGTIIGCCHPYNQGIVTELRGRLYKNRADPLLNQYPERHLHGAKMVPFRLAGTYYFHFAVETLQTIFEARGLQRAIPIILPQSPGFFDRIPREVHDTAVEAVRAEGQVYERLEDGIYRLDEVVVPTRIKYAKSTFQKQVLDVLGVTDYEDACDNGPNGQILYIARRQGLVRAVTNEEKLIASLSARLPNFRRVYLEDMSFSDQITAFRGASTIIAPHGGGLTNIIFCRPGTGVIEFHLPETEIMYWHLSVMQRLRYLAYVPESDDPAKSTYEIQPDRLIAAIKLLAVAAPFDPDNLIAG